MNVYEKLAENKNAIIKTYTYADKINKATGKFVTSQMRVNKYSLLTQAALLVISWELYKMHKDDVARIEKLELEAGEKQC